MAKKNRKISDVKLAQANDQQPEIAKGVDVVKVRRVRKDSKRIEAAAAGATEALAEVKAVVAKVKATPQAKATKAGAGFHVLAGRPSKQAVVAVFGPGGYAMSWASRAAILKVTPENLAARFVHQREQLKSDWAEATAKPEKK
jgi:hypothetical protein